MSKPLMGRCEHGERVFFYALVHPGFNHSACGYGDTCGNDREAPQKSGHGRKAGEGSIA